MQRLSLEAELVVVQSSALQRGVAHALASCSCVALLSLLSVKDDREELSRVAGRAEQSAASR